MRLNQLRSNLRECAFYILFLAIAMAGLTGLSGCDSSTAKTCIEKGPELASMCQAPGSDWKLLADGTEECGLNGVYQPASGQGGGGQCNAEGACSFSCTVSSALCPYGVSYITHTEYACAKEAGEQCDAGETQCVNGQVATCNGGSWSQPEDCPGSQICEREGATDNFNCVAGRLFSEIQAEARGGNREESDGEGSVNLGEGGVGAAEESCSAGPATSPCVCREGDLGSGNICSVDEFCFDGLCVCNPGGPCAPGEICQEQLCVCGEGNICTEGESCQEGQCVCGEGDICTEGQFCDEGQCSEGASN